MINRTTKGRFASGASGNPEGRPARAARLREEAAENLAALGFSAEEVAALVAAAGNRVRPLVSLTALAGAVVALIDAPRPTRRRRKKKTPLPPTFEV